MNRVLQSISLTFFTLIITFSCCKTTCPETSDLFQDPNFEKAIRLALDQPEGDISKEDLKSLVSLRAGFPEDTIRDINGIELCENLLSVDLHNRYISHI